MTRHNDRRAFIKQGALGVAALTLKPGRLLGEDKAPVSLVQIQGPGVPRDLDEALRRLLEPMGGIKAFVRPGQNVLVKPNLAFPNAPEVRANTNPQVLAAVVRAVIAAGGKVTVADYSTEDPDEVRERSGLARALKGLDVKLLLPEDEDQFLEVLVRRGKDLKRTAVLKVALKADVHIAVPLAKSHSSAGFTGVLKGNMGLIWSRKPFHFWHNLHKAIAELNSVPKLRPHLSIMDGLAVMASGGPRGPGEVLTRNTLIAGTDPVAVDACGVRLAPLFGKRMRPRQVKHLALAEDMGLGRSDQKALELSFL